MPRPVFIICSQSASEDAETHFLSLFQIVEQLMVPKIPEGSKETISRGFSFRITAVWMRGEEDTPEQTFDSQLRLHFPGTSDPRILGENSFSFSARFQRFSIILQMGGGVEPGVLLIEHRIRRAGDEQWLSQTYPIPVEETKVPDQSASCPADKSK